jgi:hypothetical protein
MIAPVEALSEMASPIVLPIVLASPGPVPPIVIPGALLETSIALDPPIRF